MPRLCFKGKAICQTPLVSLYDCWREGTFSFGKFNMSVFFGMTLTTERKGILFAEGPGSVLFCFSDRTGSILLLCGASRFLRDVCRMPRILLDSTLQVAVLIDGCPSKIGKPHEDMVRFSHLPRRWLKLGMWQHLAGEDCAYGHAVSF